MQGTILQRFLAADPLLSAMAMATRRLRQEKQITVAGLCPHFFLKYVCPEALSHVCHKTNQQREPGTFLGKPEQET